MFNPTKRQFEAIAVIIVVLIVAIALLMSSCNVTRTVTTTAQTIQRGDTTTVIMTKTIESYDGKVDASKLLQAGQVAGGL
jgi:competence protein ComGC